MCTIHGHELRVGENAGRGGTGQRGRKGRQKSEIIVIAQSVKYINLKNLHRNSYLDKKGKIDINCQTVPSREPLEEPIT